MTTIKSRRCLFFLSLLLSFLVMTASADSSKTVEKSPALREDQQKQKARTLDEDEPNSKSKADAQDADTSVENGASVDNDASADNDENEFADGGEKGPGSSKAAKSEGGSSSAAGTTNEESRSSSGQESDGAKATTAPDPPVDPCGRAKTCEDCAEAATNADDDKTCIWKIGLDETMECQEENADDAKDAAGDMCHQDESSSAAAEQTKTTDPPTVAPKPTDSGLSTYDDDEGSNIGAYFALICLLGLSYGAYSNKSKIQTIIKDAGLDGLISDPSGPAAKTTKYRDLPSEEDDGDWGWGDDNENSGDVELAGSSNYNDARVHHRHNSFDKKDEPSPYTSNSSPSSMPVSRTVPPAPNSGGLSLSSSQRIGSGGSAVPPPAKKTGMSLTGPKSSSGKIAKLTPVAKPSPAPAPVPQPVAPTMSAATTMPMAITSLGKKKTSPVKPKKPAAPKEDDIFASMGLSAKPTFSHAPAPAKPASTASSRWAIPAPATAPAPSLSATANFDDAGSDDWGDDDDLNDLLDD